MPLRDQPSPAPRGATASTHATAARPAPAPAEATRVTTPLLLHFAGLDDRVNATGLPWVAALKTAGKPADAYVYAGVNHAFNKDTSAQRFDPAAAALAWTRTLEFFAKHLR